MYQASYISRIYCILILISIQLQLLSCKKFLDEKPRKADVVPESLSDLQRLLDNEASVMNAKGSATYSELISDNYYITDEEWQLIGAYYPAEAFNYNWEKNADPYLPGWMNPYQGPIYYSNIVMDQLSLVRIRPGEESNRDMIRAAALFYRAFAFWELAQLYCKPYSVDNEAESGIVLKISSNVNERPGRATIKQTYQRIIADLEIAASLLPATSLYPTRPTRVAAFAALARAYLSMGDYQNAEHYADLALHQYEQLVDFNLQVPVKNPPMKTFNAEVIFHNGAESSLLLQYFSKIDSTLINMYDSNDLRKQVYFRNNGATNSGPYIFQGSFHGTNNSLTIFNGLTTSELLLTRAECAARRGDANNALSDLNALLITRWKAGTFINITATDAADALAKILVERRKELVFRGLRWTDIRRLNVAGANISLKRVLGGTEQTLPPNDLRSVMLIPWEEVNRSGIAQNPR